MQKLVKVRFALAFHVVQIGFVLSIGEIVLSICEIPLTLDPLNFQVIEHILHSIELISQIVGACRHMDEYTGSMSG